MINPSDGSIPAGPTADDLAGTPAPREEDPSTLHVHPTGDGRAARNGAGTPAAPSQPRRPTADDLAGMPVSVEGNEDLTRRPRKRRQSE